MQKTGAAYFDKQQTMDLAVMSDYGLDESDQELIEKKSDVKSLEFGYLKDVMLKGTDTAVRVFSESKSVSQYEVTQGRLPKKMGEIAISNSLEKKYKIGDTFTIDEPKDINDEKVLKDTSYKIVGFVNSSEFLTEDGMGQSTAGDGQLTSFAIVVPEAFDSDIYMIARMSFKDTFGVNPYSDKYTKYLTNHRDELEKLLKDQPEIRLASIKTEAQEKIDEGSQELEEGKQELADAEKQLAAAPAQLADGQKQIDDNRKLLEDQVASASQQINDGATQIETAKRAIASAATQLTDGKKQLSAGKQTLSENWQQLEAGKSQLTTAANQLIEANQTLNNGLKAIDQGKQQLIEGYEELTANKKLLEVAAQQLQTAEQTIKEKEQELNAGKIEYQQKEQEYQQGLSAYQTGKAELNKKNQQLIDAKAKLQDGKKQYETGVQSANEKSTELKSQLAKVEEALSNPDLSEVEKKNLEDQKLAIQSEITQVIIALEEAKKAYQSFLDDTYTSKMAEIIDGESQLAIKLEELVATEQQLQDAKKSLAEASDRLIVGQQQLDAGQVQLNSKKQEFAEGEAKLVQAQQRLAAAEETLIAKESEYQSGLEEYQVGLKEYNASKKTYQTGLAQWLAGKQALDSKSAEYQASEAQFNEAQAQLASKTNELQAAQDTLAKEKAEGERKLAEAKETLGQKEKEYQDSKREYEEKLPDAQAEIKENETKLADAKEALSELTLPVYSVNSRREMPGSDGYKTYDSIAKIVTSLSAVFPIFLYLVAALVTLTTMTRFVDEERINAGTLKALGYTDRDVIKKFTVYGLIASLAGAIIGITAGHLALPIIVYNAYKDGFSLPPIQLHFYPGITVIALALAVFVAVVPAMVVAKKELIERPANLLLPKPPVSGSKILLERIKPIWRRMSFTQKVTARNIFRYKRRMLMTIFGVAGSVALLFTGLAVQNSISGISQRQFGEIIKYDMIVAQKEKINREDQEAIKDLLEKSEIKEYASVRFETVTKVAGSNKDKQEISLIVPESTESFNEYMHLENRHTKKKLVLSDNGGIISERLAKLLNVKVGDSITVEDENNAKHEVKINGISEMYIGHFLFMNKTVYQDDFAKEFVSNGQLIKLTDNSIVNTQKEAAKFMELEGVQGVIQNINQMKSIKEIVNSLNQIMVVLILLAATLALVILYNLTNINVSERIRELSTIKVLGFYDNEVTLYIYRETIILSLLGILTGYAFGALLHSYILTAVPPDNTMFNPGMWPTNFIIPAIITILITAALGYVVYRRLKYVNMLEALKSVE